MKFKNYLKESRKKVEKEIKNWLDLNPDLVLYNTRNIKEYNFSPDILIDMIKTNKDNISIIKHTIEGNIGIQIYKDKNKIKIENIHKE